MEVVSPGANGHAPSSISSTTIDPNLVVRHLVDLLEVTLGASVEDLESPGSLLSGSKRYDTLQRCMRFASEPQDVIYVLKDVLVPSQSDGVQPNPGTSDAPGENQY
jgi:dynein heavy chain 1